MKTTIELILEMVGYIILIFAVVWAFVRFTGYGEYYDKMQRGDDDLETTIDEKENNKTGIKNSQDNNMTHFLSIKKRTENGDKTFNGSSYRNEYPDGVYHWSNHSRGYTWLFDLFTY